MGSRREVVLALIYRLYKTVVADQTITNTTKEYIDDLLYFNTDGPFTPDVSSLLDEPCLFHRLLKVSSKQLVYIFVELSRKKSHVMQLKLHLRKFLLGFEIRYTVANCKTVFSTGNLRQIEPFVSKHLYAILSAFYRYSLIYKSMKIDLAEPKSETHRLLLEMARPILHAYEVTIMSSKEDFLDLYGNLFRIFQKLGKLSQLNEFIKDRMYVKKDPGNLSVLDIQMASETDVCDRPDLMLSSFMRLHGGRIFFDGTDITDLIFSIHNKCTTSFLRYGYFDDPSHEYFVEVNESKEENGNKESVFSIEYSCVPPFVAPHTCEIILYIGKYIRLMENSNSSTWLSSFPEKVALQELGFQGQLISHLKTLNVNLYKTYVQENLISEHLDFITDIFLFRRVDFIEYIYYQFKKNRNLSKRSALNLMDDGLVDTFFQDSSLYPQYFRGMIDLMIDDVSLLKNDQNTAQMIYLEEPFGLFYRVKGPVDLVIRKTICYGLLRIFKFLWKVKKIEHLVLRLHQSHQALQKYLLFIFSIQSFIFNELPMDLSVEWDNNKLAMDGLCKSIESKIAALMERMFLHEKDKKFEKVFYEIEVALIKLGLSDRSEFYEDKIHFAVKAFSKILIDAKGCDETLIKCFDILLMNIS